VGGQFSQVGAGLSAPNIARWDGQDWHTLGGGVPTYVCALALFQDNLFAGGYSWNGAGWTDELQTDGPVHALTVYHDRLIAGGSFTTFNGNPAGNIGAWPDEGTPAEEQSLGSVKAMFR